MNRHSFVRLFVSLLALLLAPLSVIADEDQSINPPDEIMNKPSPVLSPQEALKSFKIEEGFEIQLVAAEPLIEDPICMAWDEDGRLWVCEMTTYMPDQKGTGEEEPKGNIVILEDTDADGMMDKRTVFMDGIILPRAIAHVNKGILYADYQSLYYVRINPNGSPGARIPVDRAYANNGGGKSNVEHQANGLLYGLDNWFYNAKSSRRYKQVGARFRRADTEYRGQWGITQDDDGRLLANRNPILIQYELFPPSATLRNDNFKFNKGGVLDKQGVLRVKPDVYPIHETPGVNRGYRKNTLDHDTWKLKVATAACGPVIYRADQFPDEYYNDVFIPEPAGNLVKRVVLKKDSDGKPTAEHAYENREFLASTDERNRFVNAYTGPDGCLYLVDMYRGLIQHKTYITDYLRRQIDARDLDKPIGMGRIYRVVHKDNPVDHTPPKLSEKPSAELVALLGNTNAWYRETAQRLLVQRRDEESVRPLELMATSDKNPQARIHALWTLEGMGKLGPAVLAAAGESENPRVRAQVLRLAESYGGEPEAKQFVALMKRYSDQDPNWELDLQIAFTAGVLASIDTPQAYDVLSAVLARRGDTALFRHAAISGLQGKEAVMLAKIKEGPLVEELTGVMMSSVDKGDLSIGSLVALIDSEQFKDQREKMLSNLASQAVQQNRDEVLAMLIERLGAEDATVQSQQAILQGMVDGRAYLSAPAELDGKPELFAKWMDSPPNGLEELVGKLTEVFVFEKTVVSQDVIASIERGKLQYAAHCSTCHGEDGRGLEGGGPPIYQSDWPDKMEPEVLTMLLLDGAEGDIVINGKKYSPPSIQQVMTGFKNAPMTDQDIADVLTFIRSREMGNGAEAVSAELVAQVRKETATRATPYAPTQLQKIDASLKSQRGKEVYEPKMPLTSVVHAGWVDHSMRNLIITLVSVTVPLVLLLVLTIFGGGKPMEAQASH